MREVYIEKISSSHHRYACDDGAVLDIRQCKDSVYKWRAYDSSNTDDGANCIGWGRTPRSALDDALANRLALSYGVDLTPLDGLRALAEQAHKLGQRAWAVQPEMFAVTDGAVTAVCDSVAEMTAAYREGGIVVQQKLQVLKAMTSPDWTPCNPPAGHNA